MSDKATARQFEVISRDVVESQEGQQDSFVLDSRERSDTGNGKLVMESPDSTDPGVNDRDKPAQLGPRIHSKRKKRLQHLPTHHFKVCQYCGTTSTPVWRKAGQAKDVILCNACSLRLRRSERRSPEKPSPCKAKQQVSPPPEQMEGKPGRDELTVDDVMHKYPNNGRGGGDLPAVLTLTDRERLADLIFQEKMRLLGTGPTANPQWSGASYHSSHMMTPDCSPWDLPPASASSDRYSGWDSHPVSHLPPDLVSGFIQGVAAAERRHQMHSMIEPVGPAWTQRYVFQ